MKITMKRLLAWFMTLLLMTMVSKPALLAEEHVHNWGEPVWEWSEDLSSATAIFTCLDDSTHTIELEASIEIGEGVMPAGCTDS